MTKEEKQAREGLMNRMRSKGVSNEGIDACIQLTESIDKFMNRAIVGDYDNDMIFMISLVTILEAFIVGLKKTVTF